MAELEQSTRDATRTPEMVFERRHSGDILSNVLPLQDETFERLAKIIGRDTAAVQIRDVIERSNAGGYLFHGIKKWESVCEVREKGVLPLTPEGTQGKSSFWTSGKKLFLSGGSGEFETFDTTFFHWAHTYDADSKRTRMAIAITNERELRRIRDGFRYKPDGYYDLPFAIPRAFVHLLVVDIAHIVSATPRSDAARAESILIDLLCQVLREGYESGGETQYMC